jgi:hypothetical protein
MKLHISAYREAGENASMRLFNARLSGLRTVMSENVFGIWKKRFPVLRMLRTHYQTSKDIILATAILHNVALKLGEVSQPYPFFRIVNIGFFLTTILRYYKKLYINTSLHYMYVRS